MAQPKGFAFVQVGKQKFKFSLVNAEIRGYRLTPWGGYKRVRRLGSSFNRAVKAIIKGVVIG